MGTEKETRTHGKRGEARSKSTGKGELSEDGSVGRWPQMKVGTELKGNR